MNAIQSLSAVAVIFLVAQSPCFALWEIAPVSKELAKEMGMVIRSEAAGHVRVELEFKIEGQLKDFSSVDLRIGAGDNPAVTAPLREDRSKPGSVVVGFTADRGQLDQSNLRVMVPYSDGGAGGIAYVLRVKDFVE